MKTESKLFSYLPSLSLHLLTTHLFWVAVHGHHTLPEAVQSVLAVGVNVDGLLVSILGLRVLLQPLQDLAFANMPLYCDGREREIG
ncbi:hypothetical protein E2C01_038101 [Portunus trituberculatus]|uniref:Uncharacterized protein n=1 Tax=Portunus trituberculatus TaxID=210409 RepID=A0A5B7FHL8_PORTR|nr:hypothetical protein [Portunus trituberculatus]